MPQSQDNHQHKSASTSVDPWRIGVLFSRCGITSVTETEHFLGTALAVEEINAAGGILGRPLEPVAFDPKGNPGEYRRLADRLLSDEEISVIFGCSTSSSRKAVLPAVERRNGLLWYCSLYEGFEFSPNIIYTGAAPNQNSLQLAAYLLRHRGKRFYLIGSDYIYPRESNRIMRDVAEQHGGEIVGEVYLPYEADIDKIGSAITDILKARPEVVFSTVVGRPARDFYRLYHERGIDPEKMPIASLTMVEGEIHEIGPSLCRGHIASATYFGSLATASNARFVASYRARFGATAPVSMWSEGAYSQVHLFAKALERSGSMDTQKLTEAALGLEFESPEGVITVDPENHHSWLRPRIGIARDDGSFDIVWEAKAPVKPDPYLTSYGFADFWLT